MSVDFYSPNKSFNVANVSAGLIVRELLGQEFSYSGSLDPREVLSTLATARPEDHVREGREYRAEHVVVSSDGVDVRPGCRISSSGYDQDRINRYVESLRDLAEDALAHGDMIHYV